jgi:hypothetical protein
MNLPSGLVFYLDFQYGKTFGGKTAGQSLQGTTGPKSPFNGDTASENSGEFPTGGLYGAGQYGYTSITASYNHVGGTGGDITAAALSTTLLVEVDYDSQYSESIKANSSVKVTLAKFFNQTAASSGSNIDEEAMRSFVITSGSAGVGAGVITAPARFIKQSGDSLTFIITGTDATSFNATNAAANNWNVEYKKQPVDYDRGDFEDKDGGGLNGTALPIPEVNLDLKSSTIVAKTRKLKAVWTPELAQDLNAYHSIDAEAELTSMLSEYISMEIDLEIIDMLLNDAVTTSKWSAKVGFDWDGSDFTQISGQSNAYTKKDWYETLGVQIQDVSNKIHQLTLRGGANFLVCSPQVATIIESIPGFAVSTDGQSSNFAMGVAQVGSLQNRWTVYKNPYMVDNTILCGFRGSNFLETGAVYAPYVPLIMTPLVYDPDNFTPRKGVMTRYAKKMVRPEFYGKIYIHGLEGVGATSTV